MKTKYFKIFLSLIVFSLAIFSCDAPRDNPLDPNNTENNISTINGIVKTHGFPFTPIYNVNVHWENGNAVVQTNQFGEYNIPSVIKKNGWLKFKHEGYSDDSTFIDWGDSKAKTIEILLNSKPKLDSLEFFSVVENRFQSNQKSELRVRARVSDFEGVNDIVSVFIGNEELDLLKTLTYDHTEDFYESELTLSDLKVSSLNEIIGKDFEILVNDLEEKIFVVGITNIKRIINEEIELIAPLNNETVGELIKFNWVRYSPGYNHTFRIEIFTKETFPTLVYSEGNIPEGSITRTVISGFPNGNYFWTIWAVDEFHNQSRSKEGSFIIETN